MSDPHWASARRILAIRLDSIGDVLMTTPALRALRTGPAVEHLALLTSPSGAGIAAMIPEVDDVVVYEAPWMKAGDPHDAAYDAAMVAHLNAQAYDAAAIFTVYSQTPFPAAMLCRLAHIPLVLAHCRERAYRLVSDAVPESEPEEHIRHEVQRHIDLVATLGWRAGSEAMSLTPSAQARTAAGTIVKRLGLEAGPWALVHPGATAPSRRYPAEGYATAMQRLSIEHGWRFVLTGDAGEADLCDEVVADAGTGTSVAGQLDLPTLVALIGRAPLIITNNTGPAHIAAALGTPVVDLYALTNPQHTPWGVAARVLSHDVPCRWCYASVCREGHHLCLRGVSSAAVVEAALELVAGQT